MAIQIGIAAIIIITVIMLILRMFFKKAFKIISIVWFVLFLGAIAFTILVYIDAKDIRENFIERDNLYLLESEGKILAGFITKGVVDPEMIEGLDEIQLMYNELDFNGLLKKGDYYKLFVMNEKSFSNIEGVDLGHFTITPDEAFTIIKSADSPEEYEKMLGKRNFTDEGTNTNTAENIKGLMFYFLYAQANIEQGPMFLVENIKNKNIILYEETIVFKLIRYFPSSFMKGVFDKKEVS